MDDRRLRVPAEQLFYACTCGRYISKTPGSLLGVTAHHRKSRCGGSVLAVLPEDLVVAEEMEAKGTWTPDEAPEVAADVPVAMSVPAMAGPVAEGKVIPPDAGGPTQFRGPAAVPAGLYAIYDAFRTQKAYEGSIDAWLVECTELYCEEVLGIELVLQARFPEPLSAGAA